MSTVHIQIVKELLDLSTGYINVPKAFYAKTRNIFNETRNSILRMFDSTKSYREQINDAKRLMDVKTTSEALRAIETVQEFKTYIDRLEQGGFHDIYLAFEYILARKRNGTKSQKYSTMDLCEKCNPTLIQHANEKLYFHNRKEVRRYLELIAHFANGMSDQHIGIDTIDLCDIDTIVVKFA